jgi:hypothetical protein
MPAIRRAYAGTDVIANPLHAVTVLFARKNVEAKLRPVIDPLR